MTETSTGTNVPVTDEMVETAARAMDHAYNPDRTPILAAMFRDYARAALDAAAPLIAADALREAANELDGNEGEISMPVGLIAVALRARADQIEKEGL